MEVCVWVEGEGRVLEPLVGVTPGVLVPAGRGAGVWLAASPPAVQSMLRVPKNLRAAWTQAHICY